MLLARVDGHATATIRHPSLKGWRQLVCQPLDEAGNDAGGPLLAVDPVGAGLHERVILTSDGLHTRTVVGCDDSPLRYLVLGIADPETGGAS